MKPGQIFFAMKQVIFILFLNVFLVSCVSYNRIVDFQDPYKELNGMTLVQLPVAFSTSKTGSLVGRVNYDVTMDYLYQQKQNERPNVFLTVQIRTAINRDELDSALFIDLDGEKIRLNTEKYRSELVEGKSSSATSSTSTVVTDKKDGTAGKEVVTTSVQTSVLETADVKIMKQIFSVPENLWDSISHSEKIAFRIYLGKEGVDVKLRASNQLRLNEFFARASQKRDAGFPSLPEGQMRW